MNIIPKLPGTIAYGGDYNPEQWPESVWHEDVRLMREAGVNVVSLAVFSWARLQPTEHTWDFGWLDRIIDLLSGNGIFICLATATGSPPPWMSVRYPDVLPVDASGLPLYHGSRQHYSPSSPTYRRFAVELVRQLAERYGRHPAVVAWHINNEFACHTSECHSPASTEAFREWLKKKYATLDRLNAAWGTTFWSQVYSDWEEIFTPRRAPHDRNPSQQLDYRRFMSDAFRELYRAERAAINEFAPDIPATTNLVWFARAIDGRSWASELDFVSWDCYPDPLTGHEAESFSASGHDVMRSLKRDRPFVMIEQAPSAVTWRPVNPPKPPGVMRLGSLQALARGADGVMFFQWRASRAGAEKYITGMVGHGDPAQSRVFGEVKALGADMKKLGSVAGTLVRSRVAIVFDWQVCWALELEAKPARIDYPGWVMELHRYFYVRNIPVDFVHPGSDLAGYDLVVAPALYLLSGRDADNIRRFVERGGTFCATYFSGIVDENEHVVLGGYPGRLRDVLGVRVEEWVPYADHQTNGVRFADPALTASARSWAEVLHLEGAQAIARYTGDFFAESPAVTEHRLGQGTAFYLSTRLDEPGLAEVLRRAVNRAGVRPVLETPRFVEATLREGDGKRFLFLLNHGSDAATVDLEELQGRSVITDVRLAGRITLPARDAVIVLLD